jgi:hypothetical protein
VGDIHVQVNNGSGSFVQYIELNYEWYGAEKTRLCCGVCARITNQAACTYQPAQNPCFETPDYVSKTCANMCRYVSVMSNLIRRMRSDMIRRLYIDQDRTLKETQVLMRDLHSFYAS